MGFFNRDYRCFDNDSLDTAAMMESIFESTYDTSLSVTVSGTDDGWSSGSAVTGSWDSDD